MLTIANKTFTSRLFTGTGKFSSAALMEDALLASGSELVTVALKRVDMNNPQDDILRHLQHAHINLLPNTSGVRTAKEAVFAAQLAREALLTNWLKLEIHPDPKYLMPDAVETLRATEELVKMGFVVLPYIHADPVLCKRLEEVGAAAVMPLGSPIGSNKGLRTIDFLEIIIEQSNVPVIVDAGRVVNQNVESPPIVLVFGKEIPLSVERFEIPELRSRVEERDDVALHPPLALGVA